MLGKANRCCLARVQPSILHPGNGHVVRRWLLSPPLRRGQTSTMRVRSVVDVVVCSVSDSLAHLAPTPPPTPPPAARPIHEDLSGDLPVQAGPAAIRRCGVGAQVAAVIGAEVVVARGGCLCQRDRQRHLRPDLRLLSLDGLSSPLEWGRGRGPFHSSVRLEVIAAAV
jgi:hypothetical protein